MTKRQASCDCGQLHLTVDGEPVRISMCHCHNCQRRTGSIFGTQARFKRSDVSDISGRSSRYERKGDSGNAILFHFCPDCGSTVYWEPSQFPDLLTVAIGTFADPYFPSPRHSVYERRQHPWAMAADSIEMEHLE